MRLKKNQYDYFFHPFELTFSGYSNSGKTTLVEKLIKELSTQYIVGYLKNDAHKFVMDKGGKDTDRMNCAGANVVSINDKDHYALITNSEMQQRHVQQNFIESDILLIEGHKYSDIPKILFLGVDENRTKTLDEITEKKIKNIQAIIYTNVEDRTLISDLPAFHRDDVSSIKQFVLNYFYKLFPSKLNGLVLTGGKSSRMLQDKGALNYYDKPQILHTVDLLHKYTDEVYVSCRDGQYDNEITENCNMLFDAFPSVGPTTGIITAMNQHPKVAWLVLACDLPYLDENTVKDLVEQRNPFKVASSYLNPLRGWAEPLCAIYEPKSYYLLMSYFANNRPCPRKVLMNTNIQSLELKNKLALNNVNTPEEYDKAKDYIQNLGVTHAD